MAKDSMYMAYVDVCVYMLGLFFSISTQYFFFIIIYFSNSFSLLLPLSLEYLMIWLLRLHFTIEFIVVVEIVWNSFRMSERIMANYSNIHFYINFSIYIYKFWGWKMVKSHFDYILRWTQLFPFNLCRMIWEWIYH